MDILFEILFEVYGELMLLIVPGKGTDKKFRVISKIIAIVVVFGVIALALWGVCLIFDKENLLGIIPLAFAVVISLFQIVAGIILYKKNHPEDD